MGTSEHYCLRWNNHQNNLLGVFSQLLRDESLVDVTLACSEGHSIRAHRVVLSACSSYFQTLFVDHPSRHPIVILKDVRFAELRTLIEFMYRGEVNVEYCQLPALLKTAESLKVKGLAEMTNVNSGANTTSSSSSQPLSDHDQQQQRSADQRDLLVRDTNRDRDVHMNEREQSRGERERERERERDRLIERDRIVDRDRDRIERDRGEREPTELSSSGHHRLTAASIADDGNSGGGAAGSPSSRRQCDSVSPPPTIRRSLLLQMPPQEAQVSNDTGGSSIADTSPPQSPEDSVVNLTCPSNAADAPSDLSVPQNNNNSTSGPSTASCSRISTSPHHHDTEPIAGPSGLPPVQQVPLSLKKEVDWGGGAGDEKNVADTEYSRHPYDQEMLSLEGSASSFPCMYCGATFPHQSKLTRHILSHSLETLKYREQLHQLQSLPPPLGIPSEALVGGPFSRLTHDSQQQREQAAAVVAAAQQLADPGVSAAAAAAVAAEHAMELELEAAAAGSGSGVLCKFCGKSFPDVGSLIAHLPAHTGDRPFKCEFCGKAFKLRHHMKDHCRVHTGERPFRCSLCGKTFSRSTILKAHEKTHYPKYVRKFLSPSPLDTEDESNPHQ